MLLMRVLFQQLEFFYGGENENFARACNFWLLSNVNKEFYCFSYIWHWKKYHDKQQPFQTQWIWKYFLPEFQHKKKISTVFIWHSKKKQKPQFQNVKNIFLLSQWMTLKKLIFLRIKILNTYFINLTTGLNLWKEKN